MKYFKRHAEPKFLKLNAAHWNQQWAELKTRNRGARFNWYKYDGRPVNQVLFPFLKSQTQEHCSYCDGFPLHLGDETIDHFCPKSILRFLRKAYSWKNLYCACNSCQKAKMEQYDDNILRPDANGYSFDRYFIYNYSSHKIDVNPSASSRDQKKANITCQIFQFNHKSKIIARRLIWELWSNSDSKYDQKIDDLPYRFIFPDLT